MDTHRVLGESPMPAAPTAPAAMPAAQGEVSLHSRDDGALVVRLSGRWELQAHIPSPAAVESRIDSDPRPSRVVLEATNVEGWDTSLLTFVARITQECERRSIAIDRSGLPSGLRKLLALAEAVPEKKGARRGAERAPILDRIGSVILAAGRASGDFLAFVGRFTIATSSFARGRASYRRSDLFLLVQQCGAQALPIVSLISFLVGAILAFVGAVQLEKFGAAIYVADLVGIAMVRDMGAMMTAIVMAGRTGAAFAAEIGTMKVNREIDALSTMGVSPVEFLVLPRMVALFLMMPILCLYSDLLGILGGAAVGTGMLDLSPLVYYNQTVDAVHVTDVAGGVFKASVYGVLVAIAGCMRGMECGNSALAVGEATTSAVVTSIVLIIGTCGVFAVVFYLLGI